MPSVIHDDGKEVQSGGIIFHIPREVETVQHTKKLSEAIDSIQEAITILDQRITALEKPKQ